MPQVDLPSWPQESAGKLRALIHKHAHSGAYAVFDADNTSYRHDLLGALLPFMEMRGVLTRETMAQSLQLIPFKDSAHHKESLNSYYLRLGEIDDQVGYPWASQIFSGFTLRELKGYVDDLLAYDKPIPVRNVVGDNIQDEFVQPPKPMRGQQELYKSLMQSGIEVFVVSAASEEIVRMVVSDPQYGYNVKPENVIGVSLLLRNRHSNEITTARKQISLGQYDQELLMDHELTPTLWAPMPWYEGKQAAIHSYIHPWKRPILVAGDTPESDGPMLIRGAHVEEGGYRLFVARSAEFVENMDKVRRHHAEHQRMSGVATTAQDNWITVRPDEIQ